ncbi:MAG: asparaginase [Blastocatellia bacterium]|nr:asparaginase [Blastocatellia bacterium]
MDRRPLLNKAGGDFYYRGMNSDTEQISGAPASLVEVTRGAMVESRHRGTVVVVSAEGERVASLGDPETRTWYRSAAKPFQTIPIVTSGAAAHFALTPRELAVITGSHSGEEIHLDAVRAILEKIGLDELALQCGAHTPFDEAAAKRLRAEGRPATALHNNCSGKHAGMLAFARHIGAPIETYLDPEHAIQRRIREALARFAAVPPEEIAIAVDGCSAPVFGVSLTAMARSYAQLVGVRHTDIEADPAAAAAQVVDAMLAFPEMIGGTRRRLDTDLMRIARGRIIAKVGAEGVQLLGVKPDARYPRGLGIAIKIEDGDIRRARDPVVIETLRQLGLLDDDQLAALAGYAGSAVFNHRKLEVGEVRARFTLCEAEKSDAARE